MLINTAVLFECGTQITLLLTSIRSPHYSLDRVFHHVKLNFIFLELGIAWHGEGSTMLSGISWTGTC